MAKIQESKKALQALEERYQLLFEGIGDMIVIYNRQGDIISCNRSTWLHLGYDEQEMGRLNIIDIVPPAEMHALGKTQKDLLAGKIVIVSSNYRKKDDQIMPVEINAQQIHYEGEPALLTIARDITNRIQVEKMMQENQAYLEKLVVQRTAGLIAANEQLQQEIIERKHVEAQLHASLAEKDILLKEIQHRVKNNLQVISSLLYLQSTKSEEKLVQAPLVKSRNRITTLALLYESLYQPGNLARIDFNQYARSLIVHLFKSYGAHAAIIQSHIDIQEIFLDIDTAINCGLIINELVSNSLQHAFSPNQGGTIHIKLESSQTNQLTIIVSDDGVGLPAGLDVNQPTSLGLQLVNNLVEQNHGTITVDTSHGSKFTILMTISTQEKLLEQPHAEVA